MSPSDFQKLRNATTDVIFQLVKAREVREISSADDVEDDQDTTNDLLRHHVTLRNALDSVRYSVPHVNVARSSAHHRTLYELGDEVFRTFTRVNKATFYILLDLLRDDVVFRSRNRGARKPQRDVAIQLAVTLERYGAYGNGNSVAQFVRNYNIGAGTVPTYVQRVQKALLRYYTSFVALTSYVVSCG
ncbi:hypothetical protein PC123_g13935 [Phytophthora cactorum]|nr:hypothetical protein PC123_g13935 [Phytophthora cactorum]